MERGWNPNHVETSPNCPRCGSCNTKFCYYNNYSLKQPRYFCKGCRRYWTKGGSLRNVPVGGGCRRSRRGKSIRLLSDRDLISSVFPYGNYNRLVDSASSSHCCVSRNDHFTFSASKPETSNVSAAGSIDIAQVYANFSNHRPAEQEASVEMTGLPQCGSARDQYPSLISQQFASVSNYMHMEFSSTNHDHLIPKQQENYGLPPWIGEMMDPNHILNAPQMPEAAGAVGIEQGSAQSSDHFVGYSYGNSVYTSTCGYGTLFGPQ
ncbi:hypothetical protein RHSIM_Rhsim03G0064100 [Rhododendron simsii]|uniref:Dof zinc finger protein n=1 Tax=Rhododendron simsii TaxID=118357 RepID=A0A834HJE1_RHOSS|nr:hypothetical protein RHSIM_Rhsim03G0064100 [Rhododendron simsii]